MSQYPGYLAVYTSQDGSGADLSKKVGSAPRNFSLQTIKLEYVDYIVHDLQATEPQSRMDLANN
jgi:hypothetical protein